MLILKRRKLTFLIKVCKRRSCKQTNLCLYFWTFWPLTIYIFILSDKLRINLYPPRADARRRKNCLQPEKVFLYFLSLSNHKTIKHFLSFLSTERYSSNPSYYSTVLSLKKCYRFSYRQDKLSILHVTKQLKLIIVTTVQYYL